MKRWLSALLLMVMLAQALPMSAMASVGRVLSDEELDRAYALTGLGKGDGLYHNGMALNESMNGMQLVGWLEERLEEKLHNIDDVLARARFRLAELEEKYPTLYEVFTQSPFYEEAQALALQAEQLRQDLNYRLERVKTDVNMIDAMRSRMQNTEASMFDSDRVRASARIEAATAEIIEIRSDIARNAASWDATLLEWTAKVQYDTASGSSAAITAGLQALARSLWKKFNLGEGSDEAFVAELKALLKARYLRFMPGSSQADAVADDAIALMRDMWQQYDPDGETGMAIVRQLQSLMERLYQKYGPDGAQDAGLIDDVEALMRQLWQDYGPQSPTNRAFVSAWAELMQKYGFDGDSVDEFIAELDALAEELWNKYGPDGEGKDALLAKLRELWNYFGSIDQEGSVAQWLSSLFTAGSEPVTNSAPVTAMSNALSRSSRLSSAAGVRPNDADASVTVISKDQICLSFVIGVNQQRQGVPGVEVRFKDASIAGAQLSEPQYSNEKGMVILPTNLFVADEYDEVHLYVEVDPRKQGYRNYIIEDLEVSLGQTFMDTLVPMEDEGAAEEEGVVSNAASEPYMISASFNGKDIMHSEYEMINSPANDAQFTVKAVFNEPEGKQLPGLVMTWYENDGSLKSLKKYSMEPTSKKTTPEGYQEYTFTGKWKQRFSPNASEEQRPTFFYGKGGNLKFPTKLVALRSATSVPLNEGTGAEGGVFANVLEHGTGISFKIPTVGIYVNFNLPIEKYLPHLSINPAGMVVMWIGMSFMGKKVEEANDDWKNRDMKKSRLFQKNVEKQGWLADYKSKALMAAEDYVTMPHQFMHDSNIDIGIFAVATGRWELDNDIEDVKSTNVRVSLGFGLTVTYENNWTMHYQVGPMPSYIQITLGVYAGISFQFSVDFCWVNGGFQNWKIYPIDEFTFYIGFYLAAQVGVGIKGLMEVWVRLIASLDVIIHLVLLGVDQSYMDVTASIDLSIGATLFFLSYRWNTTLAEWTLYTTRNSSNDLLSHYMNAEKNDGKVQEAAYMDPQSYPELTPKLVSHLKEEDAKASFKVVRVNEKDYVFNIERSLDKNNKLHRRVNWMAVGGGNADDTQTAIDTWQPTVSQTGEMAYQSWRPNLNDYEDYAFDVVEADGLVFLVVACAAKFNDDEMPRPNEGIDAYTHCNQIFYLLVLQPDSNGKLTSKLDQAYYSHSNTAEDHCLIVSEPVALARHTYGSSVDIERYYYESITDPEITWAKATWENKRVRGVEMFGTFGRITYSEDAPAYGATSFQMVTGNGSVTCYTDEFVQSGMGKGYARRIVRGAVRLSADAPEITEANLDLHHSPGFVALSVPKDGEGDTAIEVFDFEMNAVRSYQDRQAVVLERGDIRHFEMLQTPVDASGKNYNRMIFYTERETNDDGAERCRLYGLYLEPVVREGRELTFTVTKTAYDLVIPDGLFKVTYMGQTPYIYWVSASQNRDNKAENRWRVWTVAYDTATNTMADASVFAEFEVPPFFASIPVGYYKRTLYHDVLIEDTSIFDMMLMGTGTSYFSAVVNEVPEKEKKYCPSPVSLWSFQELLKPVADMKAAITQAPAVSAGSFEDISLSIMNEGNMGIATFDVAMYDVQKSGDQEKETLVETVHVNCVDPEKSRITMEDGKVELTGAKVAHRAEDFDYTARQRDWVLSQEKKAYKVIVQPYGAVLDSVEQLDSETQYVKTDMLMPGSLGVYNTTFKIPEAWRMEKLLRFKVSALSVRSNLSGLASNAADGESELLTYVLDEKSGQLVLQQPVQANGVTANAIKSGLIANATAASTLDMELFVHDLNVGHRVYDGWDGQKWLDIVLHNYAAFDDDIKLACAVYVDGATDPYYVNLPYYEQALVNRSTQTISMPMSALVDDPGAHKQARVEVVAVGEEECALINNEFTVYLGGGSPLYFITQPEDVTVQEGEDVSFTVEVGGGKQPYTYQWQIWDEKHQKWVDLPGFNDPTLSRKDIEKKWDGCKFRCVVTDAEGTQIISQEVTLTVRDGVDTGDHSNLPLYLVIALAALALLVMLRRRNQRA